MSDDEITGGQERNASLALNWYLSPFLRVTNVVKVLDVKGGAANGDEPTIFQLRFQLAL